MSPGSASRIRPSVALHAILPLAVPGRMLGVWLRGCVRPAALRYRGPGGQLFLLAADDLGYLLRRCGQVVVRDGSRIVPVPAAELLGWRMLACKGVLARE